MGQFKSFTGLRTYTVPLQRDLRELERYLKALDSRVARLIGGEPISAPIGGNPPSTSLAKHAPTHATGGSTNPNTGSDPIGPYSFTWANEHTWVPTVGTYTPITINAASGQAVNLFNIGDGTETYVEIDDNFLFSIGNPTNREASINIASLSVSESVGAGKDPLELTSLASILRDWYRAEDITGVNDTDVFTTGDPTWLNNAQNVPNSLWVSDQMATVPSGVAGPTYFDADNAYNLNGYPVVLRNPGGQGLVGFKQPGFNFGKLETWTAICVYRAGASAGGGTDGAFVIGGEAGNANGIHFPGNEASANAVIYDTGSKTIIATIANDTGYKGSDNWHIGVFKTDGVNMYYRHDGVDEGNAVAGIASTTACLFMSRQNGLVNSTLGSGLVELIVYEGNLGTTDLELLESYLTDKYFSSTSHLAQWEVDAVTDGRITSAGDVGIGTTTPTAKLEIEQISEQLRLSYDASNYASLTVDSSGNLSVALTGTTPESTFADNANFSGEVLITGANGLYFTSKTTGQQIKTNSNDLVITADIDSTVGKVDIEGRVLITNESSTEPILQLQAAAGTGEAIEVLKSGGDDLFKVDSSGFIYGPEGTEAMRITSQTDNASVFDKKGAFDFIQDSNADADDYFAKFKTFNGTTILRLTTDGRLWKDDDPADEFMSETGFHAFIGSMTVSSSAQFQWLDNASAFFGTQLDAGIKYDGTNLYISPQLVGSGHTYFDSDRIYLNDSANTGYSYIQAAGGFTFFAVGVSGARRFDIANLM